MNLTMGKQNIELPALPIMIGTDRNRRLRYVVAGICFFLIFTLSYLYEMDKGYLINESSQVISILRFLGTLGYLPRSIISGILFLVVAVCGLEPGESPVTMNRWMPYLWILMNATFIIAGLCHDIQQGFLFSQIAVFLAVPLFYIGWMSNGHVKELYTIFSLTVMVFTFIIVLSCIIWFPYGEIEVSEISDTGEMVQNAKSTVFAEGNRYMGMMNNPSRVAHFATPGAVCSLYLLFVWRRWKIAIPAISLGFSLAMSVLAISRASFLSIILAMIGFLILYIRMGKPYKRLVMVAIIGMISFAVCFALVNRGQDNYHFVSKAAPIELSYAETGQADDAEDVMPGEGSNISERFRISGTVNDVSSGRTSIWIAFISRLNYSGHDVRFDYPVKVNDADNYRYFYFSYPHNVALDYAYRCGIPTGVLFLLLEVMGYIYCFFVLAGKRRIGEGEAFAVMGLLAFIITGNVESVDHVFTRIILVVFYLSLVPVFAAGRKVDAESE